MLYHAFVPNTTLSPSSSLKISLSFFLYFSYSILYIMMKTSSCFSVDGNHDNDGESGFNSLFLIWRWWWWCWWWWYFLLLWWWWRIAIHKWGIAQSPILCFFFCLSVFWSRGPLTCRVGPQMDLGLILQSSSGLSSLIIHVCCELDLTQHN